ncbi:MAG: lipoate--protein ligase [Bacteroidaceae bacterium]|nr:lipoate--protein ligase [Bacteroidaceae bacterium]
MAFDEFCLEKLELDEPVFYLWQNRPSVILGYNQEVNTEVNLDYLKREGILLARRVTGGGAVYHDLGNLNYTIVGRSDNLERDYPQYARMMMDALRTLGVPAELSGRNDILVEGRKVSGFAKRVCKDRLMVHGTLMFRVDMERLTHVLTPPATKLQSKGIASVRSRVANLSDFLPAMESVETFAKQLEEILSNGYADKEYVLPDNSLELVHRLAEEKFGTDEWIYGRSPRATMEKNVRMACGNVGIHLQVSGNRIVSCRFSGDFMGNLPVAALESGLEGVVYDYESVCGKLEQLEVQRYFDGVSADEMARNLFF